MGETPLSRSVLLAAEIGYRRSSTDLPHPDFIDSAEGTLHSYPIDLIARMTIRGGAIRPHVGAGCEFLWLKEKFTYRMLTREAERSPTSRFGIGPILVAGIDRTQFPRLRIEAIASFVPLRRAVSVGDMDYSSGRITTGFYGARLLWRVP